jgi:hypothetical protein
MGAHSLLMGTRNRRRAGGAFVGREVCTCRCRRLKRKFLNNLVTIANRSWPRQPISEGRTTVQKMYSRTNRAPFEASENSNVLPAHRIEEALRESVLQNTAQIRHQPENTRQVVTDVNSFVERVAGVSLDQLDDAIVDLRQLRDFLLSEGERIQREISGYLQLNHLAIDSTKSIVDNIVQWKKAAPSTSRASERSNFVGPTIPPPPSSTVAKDVFVPPK